MTNWYIQAQLLYILYLYNKQQSVARCNKIKIMHNNSNNCTMYIILQERKCMLNHHKCCHNKYYGLWKTVLNLKSFQFSRDRVKRICLILHIQLNVNVYIEFILKMYAQYREIIHSFIIHSGICNVNGIQTLTDWIIIQICMSLSNRYLIHVWMLASILWLIK